MVLPPASDEGDRTGEPVAAAGEADRVAVIIPVYNAEATIDETLASVRAQTHANLEIVVVDDGSRDASAGIVEAHAAADPRIRFIRQPNAGVAAARNRGIAESSSPFIAPVDADDLWHPDKIARQMTRMRDDPSIGLVYCWFAIIDADSRVVFHDRRSDAEGDVLEAMLLRNVVGNGSCALMRRAAVESAGGYDPSLRARRAQGCEDYKLYFSIAEHHRFALVRDILVGYRELADNMSGDFRQMLRSRDICAAEILARHPGAEAALRRSRARLVRFMISRALRGRRIGQAARLLPEMYRNSLGAGAAETVSLVRAALGRGTPGDTPPFLGSAAVPAQQQRSFR